jgi:hypothetical protein
MFVSLPSRIKQTIARDVRVDMVMLVELMKEMTILKLTSIEREREVDFMMIVINSVLVVKKKLYNSIYSVCNARIPCILFFVDV